ncbi:hypothetical protein [Limnohabitans sp. Rim8]|jgi:glucose/mannose transport system substrate-binding protein|uniref:hypothetical protein n=1 Tax=Limnohabitans sp. Rim8 TaxID=1100718 RepID=UPI003305C443
MQCATDSSLDCNAQGVRWKDVAVPVGGGMPAVKVLNSQVLIGDPLDVAQLIDTALTDNACP